MSRIRAPPQAHSNSFLLDFRFYFGYIKDMRPAFYNNPTYRKKQSEITKQYYVLHPQIKISITRICSNFRCKLPFLVSKPSNPKLYCGHSCAAVINNSRRPRRSYFCSICHKQLHRADRKYCSVKCQHYSYYNQFVVQWKKGLEDGNRGINTKILSRHIRHYLLEKFGDKCFRCGWDQKHPKTLVVPLEVNHIDGNAENNKEENLELICPNCHSLTPSFRNLNKGHGRSWRKNLNPSLESSALIK